MKRTALRRDTPKSRAFAQTRGPVRAVSPKREAQRDERREIRTRVYERDSYRCVLWFDHQCYGGLSVHHLRKASQGGPYAPENLVTLCVRLNGWVEDEPDHYHRFGLVVRRGETLSSAWERMRRHGLVTYSSDGRAL